MENNTQEQILNLIDKSQNILLLTHAKADCDGLGSMISMYLALQGLGKNIVAATNDPAPDSLSFLPSINIVQNSVASNNFIISLDIQKTPLNKIKYKLTEDKSTINIIVTPKIGRFKNEDVKLGQEEVNFDLIITFDTGNLEHLGPIYDDNAELFFKTPLINIDHHASNTDYGQINHVDMVAASTTEVMIGLLENMEKRYGKKFLNEDVATLLLAGLITDTGSFQHANTSPKAMEVAAKLLGMGARQQEIIKNIYKTKKLSTLKLWGTVLSKVETDPVYRLVWSSISKNDLNETGASAEESEGIIDDLLSNAPGAEIIMLFKYNEEGYVSVSMRSTTNSADVGKISAEMGGGGHVRAAGFKRRDGSSLERLIEDTLTKVRQYQGQRLNIHPEAVKQIMENQAPLDQKKESPHPEAETKTEESERKTPKNVQYLEFKDQRENTAKETPVDQPLASKEEKKEELKPAKEANDKSLNQQKPIKKKEESQPENKTEAKAVNEKAPEVKAEGKSVKELQKDFVSKKVEKTPSKKVNLPIPEKLNVEAKNEEKPKNETPNTPEKAPSTQITNTTSPQPNNHQNSTPQTPSPAPTPPRKMVNIPTTPPPKPLNPPAPKAIPAPQQPAVAPTPAFSPAAQPVTQTAPTAPQTPPAQTNQAAVTPQISQPTAPTAPQSTQNQAPQAPIQPTPAPPPLPPTLNQNPGQNGANQEIPPAPLV